MKNYFKRQEEYSAEISIDGEGIIEKVELKGNKPNLWQKIIEINMKHLQLPFSRSDNKRLN